MKVILGSASPRRKEILSQAGIAFEVIVSDCEERITKSVPAEVVEELSGQKAEDVWKKAVLKNGSDDDLLVIGADTIVAFGHTIYGKPKDEQDAVRMLKTLSGATHQVYTGVTVINAGRTLTFSECTDVTMYDVSDEEIRAYVESGEPMDKAGAYAIQGGAGKFITNIDGDYYAIMGLPLNSVYEELKNISLY
jgi:septum formation protein